MAVNSNSVGKRSMSRESYHSSSGLDVLGLGYFLITAAERKEFVTRARRQLALCIVNRASLHGERGFSRDMSIAARCRVSQP